MIRDGYLALVGSRRWRLPMLHHRVANIEGFQSWHYQIERQRRRVERLGESAFVDQLTRGGVALVLAAWRFRGRIGCDFDPDLDFDFDVSRRANLPSFQHHGSR